MAGKNQQEKQDAEHTGRHDDFSPYCKAKNTRNIGISSI